MKMKNIVLMALLFLLAGCSDYLKEYSQDTSYVRGYADLDELLLGDCYLPKERLAHIAYSSSSWYFPYIHIMGDETQENITTTTTRSALWSAPEKFFGYYTWQQQIGIDPNGTTLNEEDTDWTRLYYRINIANMVIANIDDMDAANETEQLEMNRIKGEAYFLRAAYYFALANLYGKPYDPETAATDPAVPIKTAEFIEDKIYTRNTVEEVYQQVISDLKAAASLLEGTTRKSFYHADQNAAELLLSRVYLYMQDYDDCLTYAEKVLARKDGLQDLNTMTAKFFLNTELDEVIFDMGNGGLRYSINDQHKGFGISDYLYGLYDNPDDLRLTYFIKYDDSSKYPEYVKGGSDVSEDLDRSSLSANYLFRTAELYLNAAEAYALKGDDTNAQKYLNALRKNRIERTAYDDIQLTGNDLIDYIRDERERELCLEGHRWFDLRRYSVNSVRPFTKTIRHSYTTWDDNWRGDVPVQSTYYELVTDDDAMTLPIPYEVISFNIGMQNNSRPVRAAVETINY